MENRDTVLFIVRHGETDWNHNQRYQGHTEVPLNDKGRRQAQATAERLAKVVLHAAYASDLSRAAETAEIIAVPHGLKVTTTPELRERNFGALEGLNRAEAMAQPWWAAMEQSDGFGAPPGGETRLQMRQRVVSCVDQIIATHQGKNILLVSHGGPIAQFMCDMLGAPAEQRAAIRLDNCSLSVLRARQWPGKPTVDKIILLVNDVAHLYPKAPVGVLATQEDLS